MPLDALCLSGVVHELQNALSGAKIDKIYQPGRDEVVLALRAPAGNVKLLLSAPSRGPFLLALLYQTPARLATACTSSLCSRVCACDLYSI